MPLVRVNGLILAYEMSGPGDGAPLLLIHGVGAQLVRWPPELIDGLAAAGFRVIRFDNRDVGLSTHLTDAGVPDIAAIVAARARGEVPAVPYTVADMAHDAAGLLDALGIDAAHVAGVSLGGMIAQALAIDHADRVRSLAILMSNSGNPTLPGATPAALAALATPAPDPGVDLEAFLAHSIALNTALGSPRYPTDATALRGFAMAAAVRAYDPPGVLRQFAASRGSADRCAGLAGLVAPSLVIHGAADALVSPAGGEELARLIPDSWHLIIDGMGHDLPAQLCPLFVAVIATNAARAR